MTEPLRSLLQVSHLLAPDDLAAIVAAHARMLGVRETVLYLADYEQATLLPLPNADVPERQELPIEGTLAGRAFRRVEVVSSASTNSYRLWMPLLDGVERLGVVEMVLPEAPSKDQRDELKSFVSLVAELVVTKDAYSDAFSLLRRRKTLSLAAEMQWELLPPLSFGTDRVVITGGLEPAYDIGGDSFDYAINGTAVDLLVIDSVGHGLPAAVLATVAISAYRHARRTGLDLPTSPSRSTPRLPASSAPASSPPPCSPTSTSPPGGCGGSTPDTPSRSSCGARRWCGRRAAPRLARWACRTASRCAVRSGWSPATGWCSTPTASPRPAPLPGSSSASGD